MSAGLVSLAQLDSHLLTDCLGGFIAHRGGAGVVQGWAEEENRGVKQGWNKDGAEVVQGQYWGITRVGQG